VSITAVGMERRQLLDDYVHASRKFSDAVARLRALMNEGEAFIGALADAGTARRACDRSRIRLDKHLAGR
jgi:hypothetical protein